MNAAPSRRAYSLLELIAVLAIMAIVAMMGYAAMRTDTVGNYAAELAARRIALDLAQARRRAIATGDNHFLQLQKTGVQVTGYTIHRRQGGSGTAVDSLQTIPAHVSVTIAPNASATPDFTFEGTAAAGYSFTLSGPTASYQVSVNAVTGQAVVTQP